MFPQFPKAAHNVLALCCIKLCWHAYILFTWCPQCNQSVLRVLVSLWWTTCLLWYCLLCHGVGCQAAELPLCSLCRDSAGFLCPVVSRLGFCVLCRDSAARLGFCVLCCDSAGFLCPVSWLGWVLVSWLCWVFVSWLGWIFVSYVVTRLGFCVLTRLGFSFHFSSQMNRFEWARFRLYWPPVGDSMSTRYPFFSTTLNGWGPWKHVGCPVSSLGARHHRLQQLLFLLHFFSDQCKVFTIL